MHIPTSEDIDNVNRKEQHTSFEIGLSMKKYFFLYLKVKLIGWHKFGYNRPKQISFTVIKWFTILREIVIKLTIWPSAQRENYTKRTDNGKKRLTF